MSGERENRDLIILSVPDLINDEIHRFYEKRYMKLCEDYVKVDMELMKMKGDDPNRPRNIIIGNTIFQSSKGINRWGL